MTNVTIWHNPRCSKSRATLQLLEDRGIAPTIRLYLTDPPAAQDLRAALDLLGLDAIALMRVKEPEFKNLALGKDDSPDRLIDAMATCPKLIERPVVFANGKAAIGRPPEAVLAIL